MEPSPEKQISQGELLTHIKERVFARTSNRWNPEDMVIVTGAVALILTSIFDAATVIQNFPK